MTFMSAQHQDSGASIAHHSAALPQQETLCAFRHNLGVRLKSGEIRIDEALEEAANYNRAAGDNCADELIAHLRATVYWLNHAVLKRNPAERERAITLITRRANRRPYCFSDLP